VSLIAPAGLALAALAALTTWLINLGRTGKVYVVIAIIVVLLLVEAAMYPSQGDITSTFFYPHVGGQNFRLEELLIPLALLARWWGKPPQHRFRPPGLAWAAFFAWYFALLVVGLLNGNPAITVLFDAKAIVYVGGGYLLVAGTDPSWLVSERVVKRTIITLLVLVPATAAFTLSKSEFSLRIPLLGVFSPSLSGDLSSCVIAVTLCLLGVELYRRPVRKLLIVACIVILLCPLAGTQRASIIELAAGVGALVIAGLLLARKRTSLNRSDLALLAGGLALFLIGLVAFRLMSNQPIIPLTAHLDQTFGGIGKQQSANDRVFLRHQAFNLIHQRPYLGWGLGKQPLLIPTAPIPPVFVASHNLTLDLLIRGGVVALALFVIALVVTFIDGYRSLTRQRDPLLVGLALGAMAAVVGFLAKSSVESLFDQFRLAVMFGLVLGAIGAVGRSRQTTNADNATPDTTTPDIVTSAARPRETAATGYNPEGSHYGNFGIARVP
jgi:O-antigen ligase